MTRRSVTPLRAFLPLSLCATFPVASADAATVRIDVRDPDGRPLADAVVTIEIPGRPPAVPPAAPAGGYAMEQRAIAFQPHVLVVPVGASVSFPNRDTVRHHVYSFSKTKRFDLRLYGSEDRRSVVFDRPGVVALGCNIHDGMSGFIVVANGPAAKTDAAGRATIADVPAGAARLTIWSTAIRQPGNTIVQPIVVAAGGTARTIVVAP